MFKDYLESMDFVFRYLLDRSRCCRIDLLSLSKVAAVFIILSLYVLMSCVFSLKFLFMMKFAMSMKYIRISLPISSENDI